MKNGVLFALAMLLAAGTHGWSQAAADPLPGIYAVKGGNYAGEVTIRRQGESYTLQWVLDGAMHQGIGMRKGNLLASSWPGGVVVYEIGADRRLNGQYPGPDGSLQPEVLTFLRPLPAAASTWKSGDTVLANWSGDEYWYPATVLSVEGDRFFVVFDDGDKEWSVADRMLPEDLRAGDRVFGNWKNLGRYYPGRITRRDGRDIHITYDDGDQEDTTISFVRVIRTRK